MQSKPCVRGDSGLSSVIFLIIIVDVCVQLEPLERVVLDIPFLLMTDVLSSSPWPILLSTSSLQLMTVVSNTPQTDSQLKGGIGPVLT